MEQYDTCLPILDKAQEPDYFLFKCDVNGRLIPPSDNFVISRTANGDVLSRYGDNIFDLSPYATKVTGSSKIFFNTWTNDSNKKVADLTSEYKLLMFFMLYLYTGGRAGYLGVSSLVEYAGILRKLCRFAYMQQLAILHILSEEKYLLRFVKIYSTRSNLKQISSILTCLLKLKSNTLNYDIDGSFITKIRQLVQIEKRNRPSLQTPVIPSRIYTGLIKGNNAFINKYLENKPLIFELISKALSDGFYARTKKIQINKGLPLGDNFRINFPNASQEHGLANFFETHQITSLQNLGRYINEVQSVCKNIIHIYSGMRNNEILSLKYNCLQREKTKSGRVIRLLGNTTKLVGVRKPVHWITSKEVETPVAVLRSIVRIVADYQDFDLENCPLFISFGYLPFTGGQLSVDKNDIRCSRQLNAYSLVMIDIEKEDLKELEKIDPYRDWTAKKEFFVGQPWPTKSHQFRRSLIVYASKSGFLTLPSLKHQLKHISLEMSLYYAKGSSRAIDLFADDKEHIYYEFNDYKPEAEALNYLYNVILSDETLFGAHGTWVEKHNKSDCDIRIMELRENTIKRFKKGEIAYKETFLGGCASIDPCDEKPFTTLTACLTCPRTILKPSKVNRVVKAQEIMLEALEPDSIEYRWKLDQLTDLKRIQHKLNVSAQRNIVS